MKHFVLLALATVSCITTSAESTAQTAVLVFSKTAKFRHESIEPGIEAIRRLGKQHEFSVDATEDASLFNAKNLQRYAAVIFLCTTGDVLDRDQQRALEQYIRAGHGFVGIHSAADTEYDWPWFGQLVGGWFDGHDAIQDARVIQTRPFGVASLPDPWVRRDEWYNYKSFVREVNVIFKLDTTTFKGSKHGADHPISWYREFDGGRMFYTGFGHTIESYSEPAFLAHLWDGINYAIAARPAER
jgi:cytochrome c